MTVSTRSLAGALADAVGRDGVVDDPARLAAAAVDGCPPRWIVRATDVAHVSAVLALASEASLAVVPRGSGSALDLGHPPARVDVVLDLRGMDRVLEYNPDDMTASVEAGLTAGAFAARLAERRQLLPVDPPGAATRTLGGLAATAAHGPLRARYGTLRDLVLGVRFVQADGVVTWGGARVVKSVTGYDVPKLMVGSLGTLGVLCGLTLRLHPCPEAEATRLLGFPSMEAACAFVARLLDSSVQPSRVELLNAVARRRLAPGAHAAPAVAVSLGSVEAAVRTGLERLDALARDARGASEPAPEGFWERYAAALDEAGRALTLHVSTPPSRLAATADRLARALADLALDDAAVVTGCAALGALDVRLPGSAVASAARLVERVRADAAELDGHAMLQRAPLAVRRAVDPWGPLTPGAAALVRALRDEFDPGRVLNPGRFVGGA